jgi:hypothetical protein
MKYERSLRAQLKKAREEVKRLLEETRSGKLDTDDLVSGLKEVKRRLKKVSMFDHGPFDDRKK